MTLLYVCNCSTFYIYSPLCHFLCTVQCQVFSCSDAEWHPCDSDCLRVHQNRSRILIAEEKYTTNIQRSLKALYPLSLYDKQQDVWQKNKSICRTFISSSEAGNFLSKFPSGIYKESRTGHIGPVSFRIRRMSFLVTGFHRQLLKRLNNPFPLISDKLGTISHSLRCNLCNASVKGVGGGWLFVLPLIIADS